MTPWHDKFVTKCRILKQVVSHRVTPTWSGVTRPVCGRGCRRVAQMLRKVPRSGQVPGR